MTPDFGVPSRIDQSNKVHKSLGMQGMHNKGNSEGSRNRYAYIKPRNAIAEIARINSMSSESLDGGPEAYVAQFLSIIEPEPALIVSFACTPEDNLVLGNNKVYSLYWGYGASLTTLASRLGACIKLIRYLMKFRPTKILCWQTNIPLWATYWFSLLSNTKFIVSRHTRFPGTDDPWYRRFTGRVDKWVVRKADAVICHGPYLKNETSENKVDPGKILEFSWGFKHMLDHVDRPQKLPDLTEGGTKRIILFVGRIFTLKGVFDLLQACVPILSAKLDTKLIYVGDGPDLGRLEKEIKSNHLDDRVMTLGSIPHEFLSSYIQQSVVLVTPTKKSFPEGRCMATMEGLVMGVPVVAPNFGPFPYVVENGVNGLLFEPDSMHDLRRKIQSILGDYQTYEKLKAGAKRSSLNLVNPKKSFTEVLRYAFELEDKDSRV